MRRTTVNSIVGRVTVLIMIIVFAAGYTYAAETEEASAPPPAESQGTSNVPQQPSASAEKIFKGGARATQIIGKAVINTQGERLGRVYDLIFSKDGCMDYLVLGHGGLLGIGNKLVPIPWKSVQTGPQSDVLIVSMDKASFEKAPSFETKQWPDFSSPELKKKIFGYFGIKSSDSEGTK
jgi:sporulation protein YlmC with PRC-barrel domain